MAYKRATLQMRRADDASEGSSAWRGSKWTCSLCQITYWTMESKPTCPMCDLYKQREQMLEQMAQYEQKIKDLTTQLNRAASNVDYVVAIQDAAELLSLEDLAWLKGVLYQWRETKSGNLKAIEGRTGPIGFLAEWPHQQSDQRICDSVGGVAIAGLLQEISQGFGSKVGLMTLSKALSKHLKGGI